MQRTQFRPITGSMIVASVSVSPYKPCLVDSVDCVLMVSSTQPLWLLQSFLPFFGVPLPSVWLWVSASAPISC